MSKIYPTIIIALAVIIFISFFLPWVGVESPQMGSVSKLLTGKRQALVDNVSGFKVPILANSDESRFMITVIQIFNPGIQDADKKSFLIWVVPLLGVVIAVLVNILGKNKFVNLAIAILGIAIFAVAVFKISTTNLDKLVLKVNIGIGLWLILYGYLAMGVLAGLRFVQQLKK